MSATFQSSIPKSPLKERHNRETKIKEKELTRKVATPEPELAPQLADVYEDDFEYEREIVTEPPPPIVEDTPLLRRLASRQGQRPMDSSSPPVTQAVKAIRKEPRIASAERRIDFSHASSVNAGVLVQMNERYRKLRELIVLEPCFFTIADVPPIKDYDFYLELFGQSGKSQSSTQTGSDDVTEETQTEEQLKEIKWTQHPAHDDYGWGSENASDVGTSSAEDYELAMFRENHLQNPRLRQFLEAAGQVVIDLISSRGRASTDITMKNRSVLAFSSGFNSFELGPIAQCKK
ncbi:unnamed protein product [Heligmosomoides polygyrus]|uniref:Uncharacterized protein n=1 Tax=Heligmosomoides polygyrus TaxID=6339 RepID=A0A183GR59_HELPZ|nr:unnamed protein product [Heligmosomoides polygyrus]